MNMLKIITTSNEIKYVNPQFVISMFENSNKNFVVVTQIEKYYCKEINSVILNFYGSTMSIN
jgi:hypothetical protein